MSLCAHLDVENKARKWIRSWTMIQRQNLAENTKAIKYVSQVLAKHVTNNAENVLKGVYYRLKMIGVVFDRLGQIRNSLVVVGTSTALLVKEVRMNIFRSTIALKWSSIKEQKVKPKKTYLLCKPVISI